ncbi:hypothetical protein CDAR_284391 [Caerostris darwini]|uniref:Uncharacterized protein n=1 Tax=Caerostris darwini TaxID=1538125 RepID=A0AAV4UKA5_9ARAC|nr:hypothetical protein CDAR_284391 [Caerostris darwini]
MNHVWLELQKCKYFNPSVFSGIKYTSHSLCPPTIILKLGYAIGIQVGQIQNRTSLKPTFPLDMYVFMTEKNIFSNLQNSHAALQVTWKSFKCKAEPSLC